MLPRIAHLLLAPVAIASVGVAQTELSTPCRQLGITPRIVDAIDTELGRNDSLWGHTSGGRAVSCTRLPFGTASLTVVALAGGDDRTGGLAFLPSRSDSLLAIFPYPAARDLKAAGNRRLLFTYTKTTEVLGAGLYESRYVVLCGLQADIWDSCLELPKDRVTIVLDSPEGVRFEEHNHVRVVGDRLFYARKAHFCVLGAVCPQDQDLRTTVLALPRIP